MLQGLKTFEVIAQEQNRACRQTNGRDQIFKQTHIKDLRHLTWHPRKESIMGHGKNLIITKVGHMQTLSPWQKFERSYTNSSEGK